MLDPAKIHIHQSTFMVRYRYSILLIKLFPQLPYSRYSFNAMVFRPIQLTPTPAFTHCLGSLMTETYDVGTVNSCDDDTRRPVI